MKSICIVANFAYGAMAESKAGHIGGVERQTALLAKWLAANTKHKVSIITWNESHAEDEYIDGVRIIKLCKRGDGFPGLRFFHPRWTSLIDALRKADADIYYQNCAEYVTGQVALWCKLKRRKFVYSVASDPECDVNLPALKTFRERALYKYGIRNADEIICQTHSQQQALKQGFKLDAKVLPMPCPGPSDSDYNPTHTENGEFRILWVGRIASVKRVELLLDIAESAPEIIFEIAGGADQEAEYAKTIIQRAEKIDNVVLHGKLNRDQLNSRYAVVSAFCNTSLYEGFPNTFLEAWSFGLPVISSIDPDILITHNRLGIHTHTADDFIAAFNLMRNSKTEWQALSHNARTYYLDNHSLDTAMQRFLHVFETQIST